MNLNELFYSNDDIKKFRKKKQILKDRPTEKDREIRVLENLYSDKFPSNYIDKMSILLYSGSKDPNYSYKRKNLKYTNLSYDLNNDLMITLSQEFKNKNKNYSARTNRNKNINNISKINNNNISNIDSINNSESLKSFNILNNNISNISIINNNNNESNISNNNNNFSNFTEPNKDILNNLNLSEEEQKIIYNTLKTRENFNPNPYTVNPYVKKYLPKNLNINFMTPNQKENLYFLSELTLFDDIQKINTKNNIIKKFHHQMPENDKKDKLLSIDLFHYDGKRWAKRTEDPTELIKEENNQKILIKRRDNIGKMKEENKKIIGILEDVKKVPKKKINLRNEFTGKGLRTYKRSKTLIHSARRNFFQIK